MSQPARLLVYLEQHPEGVTQLTAFTLLGICRLSERVRDLERLGYVIQHERVKVPSRDGNANVVRYTLLRDARAA